MVLESTTYSSELKVTGHPIFILKGIQVQFYRCKFHFNCE